MPALASGTFSATGRSAAVKVQGDFNVTLTGFGAATIQLQRRFDGQTDFHTVQQYTAVDAVDGAVSVIATEPEGNVEWRLECTAHTDNIAYRIGQ